MQGKATLPEPPPSGRRLPLINRPAEDVVRIGNFVDELHGEIPFQESRTATKRSNHGASGKIVNGADGIGVRNIPPRRDTGMTNGHAVAGVARWWDIGGVIETERIQFVLLPHLTIGRQEVAHF